MTNLKKIILFLFGIALIVFGNKTAINTIFKTEKEPDKEKTPKATEPSLDFVTRTLSDASEKKEDDKEVKPSVETKTIEKTTPQKQETPKELKKEESPKTTTAVETPKTVVEGEKAEEATATE